MTYRLKALVSTVILAPILGRLQWKIFALDFFQRCGTTLYIIEWTVSYIVKLRLFITPSHVHTPPQTMFVEEEEKEKNLNIN